MTVPQPDIPVCLSTPGVGNQLGCNPPGYVPIVIPPAPDPTTTTTLVQPGDDCMSNGTTRWSLAPCLYQGQIGTAVVTEPRLPATGIDLAAPIAGTGITCVLLGITLLKLRKRR